MLFVKTLSDLSVFPENFPSHLAVLSGKFKSGNGSYLFSSSSQRINYNSELRGINEVKRIFGSGSDTDKDNFFLINFFFKYFRHFIFLPISYHFHDWHGVRIFIFHISLYSITRVSAQPSVLHYKYRRKVWTESTSLSALSSTDSYFISRQWLGFNSQFRCQKNPCPGVPASLPTHA